LAVRSVATLEKPHRQECLCYQSPMRFRIHGEPKTANDLLEKDQSICTTEPRAAAGFAATRAATARAIA
jgi:hypothetical protein